MRAGDLLQAKEYAIRALAADARSRPVKLGLCRRPLSTRQQLAVRPESIKEKLVLPRQRDEALNPRPGSMASSLEISMLLTITSQMLI
jgi:hypothetical protein